MTDKALSLLGICRRAGKLSLGHDAAINSIKERKAQLCILCSDASERLFEEFRRAIEFKNSRAVLIRADVSMEEMGRTLGRRAGVITVDDKGFAERFMELRLNGEDKYI